MIALNTLIILYLLIANGIIFFSNAPRKNLFLSINSLIALCLLIISINLIALHPLYSWFPLIILPLLHRETGLMTTGSVQKTYDSQIIQFENTYFSTVMKFHDQNAASNKIFSEYLHACYLSFYLIIYGVPLFFFLLSEYTYFYECSFAFLLVLLACYITHALIPVHGPRTIFSRIEDQRNQGLFFKSVHYILAKGSTPGTAFPSGHTSLAAIALLITWHIHTPLFYVLLPFGIGLIISTIYGRFHYVTDVLAGIVYAIIAFFITTAVYD